MSDADTVTLFKMPSLGADMEEGKIVEWLVAPGQEVRHGDIVAVVETVKGAVEIEIFMDGVVERLLAEIDEVVPVGAPIAEIAASAARPVVEPGIPVVPAPPEAPGAVPAAAPAPAPPAAPGRVSPAARALAREAAVDLSGIKGSGPGGAIQRVDVEAAIAGGPKARAREGELGAIEESIGALMARSKREIPHYYLYHHVDLTNAEAWLARENEARTPDERLLLGALFVKAVAKAAHQNKRLNGHFAAGTFDPSSDVHVGVAVALRGGGLTAPAIHGADQLAVHDVMARMRDLVGRARAGRLKASELADPTITVSSLGDRGVEAMTAVIMPPQVAIVAFGTPQVRPWVVDGTVAPRTVVGISLSADHRVSDGRLGARFLAAVADALLAPETL